MSKQFKFLTIDDCPEGVALLTAGAQKQWMEIANALLVAGDNEQYACDRAWLAIREAWKQNDDGEYIPKPIMPSLSSVMPYSLEDPTHELKGVEVFAEGLWNGEKYTGKDLDEMVKNFGVVEAPLKIGHDSKQKLSGQPSVGWIKKLYKKGKKLYADISGIPKTVYELVKNGAYKKRSAEIFYNFVDGSGKLYNNVFGGLALLGAELPALNTLEDVVALYGINTKEGKTMTKIVAFEANIEENQDGKPVEDAPKPDAELPKEDADAPKDDPKPADEADANAGDAPADAPAEDPTPDTKVAELQKQLDEANEKLAKVEFEKEISGIKSFMKTIERKIPPAIAKHVYEALVKADNVSKIDFELADDKKLNATRREFLMDIFKNMPDMGILANYTRSDGAVNGEDKLEMMIRDRMATDKLTYKKAYEVIVAANPHLVKPAKNIKGDQ